MPRTTSEPKPDTLTFRIDRGLKAAFAEVAKQENQPVGVLLRELVREHVQQRRRRELETEARRQSRECAVAAGIPDSDEAAVMRELDSLVDDLVVGEDRS